MKISVLIILSMIAVAAGCAMASQRSQSTAIESRVAALEKEIATLKEQNTRLAASAVDQASAEIAKREEVQARLYYRTQVLPTVKVLTQEFGTKAPAIPNEEDIHTMADAYRPVAEMMTQLLTVAGGK